MYIFKYICTFVFHENLAGVIAAKEGRTYTMCTYMYIYIHICIHMYINAAETASLVQ